MRHSWIHVVLVLALMLSGCASVTRIPDKAPCTGYIKTGGDCVGRPINRAPQEV